MHIGHIVAVATLAFFHVAPAESAVIEDDTLVAITEGGHLLPPAHVVAVGSMAEHQGRAHAFRLVVQVNTVHGGKWHRLSAPLPNPKFGTTFIQECWIDLTPRPDLPTHLAR